MSRDATRSRVYAVEERVGRLLERGGGSPVPVDFWGSTLTLPPERRFADLDAVRRYVAAALSHPPVVTRWPGLAVPEVRRRRGSRAAHYEAPGVIAVDPQSRWAMRELVICHELAHHVVAHQHDGEDGGVRSHGPEFVEAMATLCGDLMGPEVGFVLRVSYSESGAAAGGQPGTAHG
jgi:putative metallohydrolase (TIGR04338 family)